MRRPVALTLAVASTLLASCTLLMPSDDELRGHHPASGGSAGTGGSSGGSGGTWPSGGAGGDAAITPCASAADWTTQLLASPNDVSRPLLVPGSAPGDTSVAWLESSDFWARSVPASGNPASPLQVSTSGNATRPAFAQNPADSSLGAVWMGTTLWFASIGASVNAHGVYSDTDPTIPDQKAPMYGAIAERPGAAGWGIVWSAFADNAERLFGLITDAQGKNLTQNGADTYTRLTDGIPCHKRNRALTTTSSGFALACHCEDGGTAWEPDIYVAALGPDLGKPLGDAAISPANGVSDYPAIAVNGSELGLAWIDDRDTGPRVWFARAAGAGAVPGSDQRLSDDAPTADRPPGIAAGNGGYGVAWQSGQSVHFAAFDAQGGKALDLVVAASAEPGQTASVVWAGSTWVVAWVGNAGGKRQVELSSCAP
jgi:hypothetical protein